MRLKYLGLIAGIILFFLMINSCQHKPKELVYPGTNDTTITPPPSSTSKCSPDTAYFTNTILPILISNCNGPGCHNAIDRKEGIVLDNYANIMKNVKAGNLSGSKLYQKITTNSSSDIMPPAGKMPQATIDLIKKWIMQGAKNNYCNDGCDTTQFTYSGSISKIISANCIGCHATGATKIGTYNELKTQVDNSKLWGAINHLQGYQPMPSPNVQISSCDIKKIRKWIDGGAPNN